MSILESVKIEGLWGSVNLSFSMDKKFNFLIGRNGSGKTTVVNLISSALKGDVEAISKIPFNRIEINLLASKPRRKPSIVVYKESPTQTDEEKIIYEIKHLASGEPKKFGVESFMDRIKHQRLGRLRRQMLLEDRYGNLREELRKLVNISWISVHRYIEQDDFEFDREESFLSPVDRKLLVMRRELSRYFSTLSSRYMEKTLEFQKNSFLSFLTSENESELIDFSRRIDVEEEKTKLSQVFELLGVQERQYSKKLNTHLKQFSTAMEDYEPSKGLSVVNFAAMYNTWKTHELIKYYEDLQNNRASIFEHRDKFVDVINNLFSGHKVMSISPSDDLVFHTRQRKEIDIEDLSSGEKQLLIIVGEALLQKQQSVIYIADEPELSLHVSWQEQLTNAIIQVNPNAQIVFATHSPDIVSIHADKVIDMESVIQ